MSARRCTERIEVAVSPPHLLGRVADPFVDEPLVDAAARAESDERMPEDVPAFDDRPP
jgi:hypothetical protein